MDTTAAQERAFPVDEEARFRAPSKRSDPEFLIRLVDFRSVFEKLNFQRIEIRILRTPEFCVRNGNLGAFSRTVCNGRLPMGRYRVY